MRRPLPPHWFQAPFLGSVTGRTPSAAAVGSTAAFVSSGFFAALVSAGLAASLGAAAFAGRPAGVAPVVSDEVVGVLVGMGEGAGGGWQPARSPSEREAAMARLEGRVFMADGSPRKGKRLCAALAAFEGFESILPLVGAFLIHCF